MQASCNVEGCDREGRLRRGMCLMHYKRQLKHGDPEIGGRRNCAKVCTVEGCDSPGRTLDLCPNHYRRLRLYGDPLGVAPPRQRRQVKRYRWVYKPGHPIATADNKILEHRYILFEKIGPGEHPCHWCGVRVVWTVGKPAGRALTADHVDHDRSNNAPSNLVPSCNACNAHRLTGEVWDPWKPGDQVGRGRLHSVCREGHAMTPDNVYVRPDTGSRQCRECARSHALERAKSNIKPGLDKEAS